jgi:DNA-binding MarR family transcriptional regulator
LINTRSKLVTKKAIGTSTLFCSNIGIVELLTTFVHTIVVVTMVNRDVVVTLMRSGNVFTEQINAALQAEGLSIQQYNVLRILRGRKGVPACLESITNDMIHRNSNTSRLVDKLIEKGFVKRKICKENRRKVDIFITPKGLEVIESLEPTLLAKEDDLTSSLSKKELEQLLYLVTKLKSKY